MSYMGKNLKRFSLLFIFSLIAWICSAIAYLFDFGFSIVFPAVLLYLVIFDLLIILLTSLFDREISLFRKVPALYLTKRTEHRSYSKKSYVEVDFNQYSNTATATYHPGWYDSSTSYFDIYQTGYAKFREKKVEESSLNKEPHYTYLGNHRDFSPENAKNDFEKIYERDKKLSKIGLTFWGTSPIWKSFVLFIPFLCIAPYLGLEGGSWVKHILLFMHFAIFICSLISRQYSFDDNVVGDKYNEREHRPIHMYILGIISDYVFLKILLNVAPKQQIINTFVQSVFDNTHYVDFSLRFICRLFPDLNPLGQVLISLSLFEFFIYLIVIGIFILTDKMLS